jgi:transposase
VEEITEETAELVARVAALDIGKAELVCCVRVPHEDKPGRRRQEVRTFATVTRSLLELRDWLICQGVTLCVMEATSTYWKPPFYLLEDAIECWVVNARDVKNVPGRPKTDLLTELRGEVPQVSVRVVGRMATFPDHDHRRGGATGSGAVGGAAVRVA